MPRLAPVISAFLPSSRIAPPSLVPNPLGLNHDTTQSL